VNQSSRVNRQMRVASILQIFFLILISMSCSDDPVNKAREFIEIGDYANANTLLENSIFEHPKDIQARRLLAECYEASQNWEKEIEQLLVLSNLISLTSDTYRLMRLYAQTEQWDKLIQLRNSAIPATELLESILKKKPSELKAYRNYLLYSLGIVQDSLLNDVKNDSLRYAVSMKYNRLLDSLSIDLNVALGLYALAKDEKGEFTKLFKKVVAVDTTYRRFIVPPIIEYLEHLKKPDSYSTTYSFISENISYYQNRAELYKSIQMYEEALGEYDSVIAWAKQYSVIGESWFENSTIANTMLNKASILLNLKRPEEALKLLSEAKKINMKVARK